MSALDPLTIMSLLNNIDATIHGPDDLEEKWARVRNYAYFYDPEGAPDSRSVARRSGGPDTFQQEPTGLFAFTRESIKLLPLRAGSDLFELQVAHGRFRISLHLSSRECAHLASVFAKAGEDGAA